MFLLDLIVLCLWNFRNGRSAHGHQCKILSPPGLPTPHELCPRSLSALWYRHVQDFVVMESILLNCSEHSEGLSFLNVFNPFSPAVGGDQPSASFHHQPDVTSWECADFKCWPPEHKSHGCHSRARSEELEDTAQVMWPGHIAQGYRKGLSPLWFAYPATLEP